MRGRSRSRRRGLGAAGRGPRLAGGPRPAPAVGEARVRGEAQPALKRFVVRGGFQTRPYVLRRWKTTPPSLVSRSQRSSGVAARGSPAAGSPPVGDPARRSWSSILSPGSVSTLASGPKRSVSSGGYVSADTGG